MKRQQSPRALSLLELVVALTILIILTTVSLQVTDGVVDQERFDSSRRTLQEIEGAILGQPQQENGAVRGFVADMGRLPTNLNELIQAPLDSANNPLSFNYIEPPGTQNIFLGTGWRGPYLRLPIGTTTIKDSYGQDFQITPNDGSSIESIAVNKDLRSPPFDNDLIIELKNSSGLNRVEANVTVTVELLDGSSFRPLTVADGDITVTLFEPDGAGGVRPPTNPPQPPRELIFNAAQSTQQFQSVTIGPRALHASNSTLSASLSITVLPRGANQFILRLQ